MENNFENKKEANLLNRLYAKFHNTKICKRMVALALVSVMATASVGCDVTITPSTDTTTPSISENNPSINANPDVSQGGEVEETTKPNSNLNKYSELLQYVLTNEKYQNIIANYRAGALDLQSAQFDPHPYAFLEDEGFDVEAIKKGDLFCGTRAFVKEDEPNNLYILTRVETKAANPYFTEYMLKYELTEKEMQDYDMLHSKKYLQAVFMNDAVSELKDPVIVSETRCTVEAHNGLTKSLKGQPHIEDVLLHGGSVSTIGLKSVDVENNKFEVYVFGSSGQGETMKTNLHITTVPLMSLTYKITLDENNALSDPYTTNGFMYHEEINQATSQKVVSYNPQYVTLNNYTLTAEE